MEAWFFLGRCRSVPCTGLSVGLLFGRRLNFSSGRLKIKVGLRAVIFAATLCVSDWHVFLLMNTIYVRQFVGLLRPPNQCTSKSVGWLTSPPNCSKSKLSWLAYFATLLSLGQLIATQLSLNQLTSLLRRPTNTKSASGITSALN